MNDAHTHQIGTPEDPETYHSEADGSCIICRRQAEADGRCVACYGRGGFTDTDDGAWIPCWDCKGTGDATPQ